MHLEADVCDPVEDTVMVQAFAHLLGSAEIGVGGVEELIEAETGCVIADEAVGLSPQSRFGDLTQPGQVFGIGCKIFTIAGPVILYGVFTSWVVGLLYWLGKGLGI